MQRVAVVTGATSGIGKACVEGLLKHGVEVIGLGRDHAKMDLLIAEMSGIKNHKLTMVYGDLSDLKSTEQAANNLSKVIEQIYQGKIDILMNVAGRVSSGYHTNQDGNEVTFHTNHLAVFQLTHAMIPYLKESNDPRILVVSSRSHYRANIHFNNLQSKRGYNILKAYKRSKLYNVLFVKAFASKYKHIPIFAIDPGLVKTNIGMKHTNKLAQWVWNYHVKRGDDASYPAQFMVDIALKDAYRNLSGHYFLKGQPVESNPLTYRLDLADRLWLESLKLTKIHDYFHKNT